MPIDNIERGPAAGGAPTSFFNTPNALSVYVDAVTGQLMVGSGAASTTTAAIVRSSLDTKVLAASVTYDATIVAATITGFSWTVAAGGTYIFDMYLPLTLTTVGGITVSFKLTTATLTSIEYHQYISTGTDNTGAVSTRGTTTTDATKIIDTKTAIYTYAKVTGSMVVNAGGTFAFQACQNTSAAGADASIILLGAHATLTRAL